MRVFLFTVFMCMFFVGIVTAAAPDFGLDVVNIGIDESNSSLLNFFSSDADNDELLFSIVSQSDVNAFSCSLVKTPNIKNVRPGLEIKDSQKFLAYNPVSGYVYTLNGSTVSDGNIFEVDTSTLLDRADTDSNYSWVVDLGSQTLNAGSLKGIITYNHLAQSSYGRLYVDYDANPGLVGGSCSIDFGRTWDAYSTVCSAVQVTYFVDVYKDHLSETVTFLGSAPLSPDQGFARGWYFDGNVAGLPIPQNADHVPRAVCHDDDYYFVFLNSFIWMGETQNTVSWKIIDFSGGTTSTSCGVFNDTLYWTNGSTVNFALADDLWTYENLTIPGYFDMQEVNVTKFSTDGNRLFIMNTSEGMYQLVDGVFEYSSFAINDYDYDVNNSRIYFVNDTSVYRSEIDAYLDCDYVNGGSSSVVVRVDDGSTNDFTVVVSGEVRPVVPSGGGGGGGGAVEEVVPVGEELPAVGINNRWVYLLLIVVLLSYFSDDFKTWIKRKFRFLRRLF